MLENSTYSVIWPAFNVRNKRRYRASFGPMSFRKGGNMIVFKGKAFSRQDYVSRSIVIRGMRHFSGNEDDFQMYELCNDQSRHIANQFNKLAETDSAKVRFVELAVAQIDKRSGGPFRKKFERDETVAFEEQLKGKFTIFIDKRGNTLERDSDCLILEAFIHFSFIVSEGNFVICGLQGVSRKEKSEIVLTNPTIHSRDGKFGAKDKRDPGIKDVLENHICNKFCRRFLTDIKT